MRDFWDARADEDAFYFVDNRLAYGDPDTEEFWARRSSSWSTRSSACSGSSSSPSDELVEIGCGIGRLTRAARRALRLRVRALDVSPRDARARPATHNPGLDERRVDPRRRHHAGADRRRAAPTPASRTSSSSTSPIPTITLGYVREMGRVLRPGAGRGFQVSNAPEIHRRPSPARRARTWLAAAPRSRAARAGPSGLARFGDRPRRAPGGRRRGRDASSSARSAPGTQFCFVRAAALSARAPSA